MEKGSKRIAMDGHGIKPSTPRPVPSFATETRGAGQKQASQRPAPRQPTPGKKG